MQHEANSIRSQERRALKFRCACRLSGGVVTDAELFDITARGTKAKFVGVDVMFGDRVEIMVTDQEFITGTIRRVAEDGAGIEFDAETGEHIIERLLFENPAKDY